MRFLTLYWSKDLFIKDLVNECVSKKLKKCIHRSGASEWLKMEMTEMATYVMKVDKTGKVLKDMVGLVD